MPSAGKPISIDQLNPQAALEVLEAGSDAYACNMIGSILIEERIKVEDLEAVIEAEKN